MYMLQIFPLVCVCGVLLRGFSACSRTPARRGSKLPASPTTGKPIGNELARQYAHPTLTICIPCLGQKFSKKSLDKAPSRQSQDEGLAKAHVIRPVGDSAATRQLTYSEAKEDMVFIGEIAVARVLGVL
jgi:hypothetical protein